MTAKRVVDISKKAFLDAIDIRFLIVTCEAGIQPAAIEGVNAAKMVKVRQCVYRALWTRLVIIVARAYTKNFRRGDLNVGYAFELLKDPSIRAAVESKGNAAALKEAEELWLKCRGDNRLSSFLMFRDKEVAHLGDFDFNFSRPIVNDILAISRNTATVFVRLAHGAGGVSFSLDSQLVTYPEEARRFWERVERGYD